MTAVAIIDSGGANIASLLFAFERLGYKAILTSDQSTIKSADRVILPGVGAARDAMSRLTRADLVATIRGLTQPVLGICLGMQLLCERSDEEDTECLGIIPGAARKLKASSETPVPNMGWCSTRLQRDHALLNGLDDGSYFYYLHSYALPVSEHTVATASHGEQDVDTFSSIIEHRNFVAAQFHPERSSTAGAAILANFLRGDA